MKPRKKKKKLSGNIWLGIGIAAVVGVIGWIFIAGSGEQFTASGATLIPTMSPGYFSKDPKAQAAYQVAKDIPEVLAELPCFCGCMVSYGHENNLFCFKDEHGSGCTVCEDIALDARDMHSKGLPIDEIKQTVREKYGRGTP